MVVIMDFMVVIMTTLFSGKAITLSIHFTVTI